MKVTLKDIKQDLEIFRGDAELEYLLGKEAYDKKLKLFEDFYKYAQLSNDLLEYHSKMRDAVVLNDVDRAKEIIELADRRLEEAAKEGIADGIVVSNRAYYDELVEKYGTITNPKDTFGLISDMANSLGITKVPEEYSLEDVDLDELLAFLNEKEEAKNSQNVSETKDASESMRDDNKVIEFPKPMPADAEVVEIHKPMPADAEVVEIHKPMPADAEAVEIHKPMSADAEVITVPKPLIEERTAGSTTEDLEDEFNDILSGINDLNLDTEENIATPVEKEPWRDLFEKYKEYLKQELPENEYSDELAETEFYVHAIPLQLEDYATDRILEMRDELRKLGFKFKTKEEIEAAKKAAAVAKQVDSLENMTDEEIEAEINELWRLGITMESMSEKDNERYHALVEELTRRRKAKKAELEIPENSLKKLTDKEIEDELKELWRLSITMESLSEKDQKRFEELIAELNRRKANKAAVVETPANPLEKLTDKELEDEINELWRVAIATGEPSEEEVERYHQLVEELSRRKAKNETAVETPVNPLERLTDEELEREINELWRVAIATGEPSEEEIERYHQLVEELSRRRKQKGKGDEPVAAATQTPPTPPTPAADEEKKDPPTPPVATATQNPPNPPTPPGPPNPPEPRAVVEKTNPPTPPTPPTHPTSPEKPGRAVEGGKRYRSFDTILGEIGSYVNEEGERVPLKYTSTNRKLNDMRHIRVGRNFVNRLKGGKGHFLYTIVGALSAPMSSIVGGITKLIGAMYNLVHPGAVRSARIIEQNLANLSEEDLEILRRNWNPHNGNQRRFSVSYGPLISQRLIEYEEEKYCAPLRDRITELSVVIADKFRRYTELQTLRAASTNPAEIRGFEADIQDVVRGSAAEIKELMDLKEQLERHLHGGAAVHSYEETDRATTNYSEDYGGRFSRHIKNQQGTEFALRLGRAEDGLAQAIDENDDRHALEFFGSIESAMIENTRVKGIGPTRRSVGLCNWELMPKRANYNPDPFMSYALTALATAGLVKGVIDSISNMRLKQSIEEVNAQNQQVNASIDQTNQANVAANNANEATMAGVRQTGTDIKNQGDSFVQGGNQIMDKEIVSGRSTSEYADMHASNFHLKDQKYIDADAASHVHSHSDFDLVQLTKEAQSGLTSTEALESIKQTMGTIEAYRDQMFKDFMADIAANPTKYDYQPIYEAMQSIVDQSSVTGNMIDAMINTIKSGESLESVAAALYQPVIARLNLAPSDIKNFIIPLASLTIAGAYVSRSQQNLERDVRNAEAERTVRGLYQEGSRNIQYVRDITAARARELAEARARAEAEVEEERGRAR